MEMDPADVGTTSLGRRTTRTTELYYGRTRPESSLAEFEQAFAELVMCVSK